MKRWAVAWWAQTTSDR